MLSIFFSKVSKLFSKFSVSIMVVKKNSRQRFNIDPNEVVSDEMGLHSEESNKPKRPSNEMCKKKNKEFLIVSLKHIFCFKY